MYEALRSLVQFFGVGEEASDPSMSAGEGKEHTLLCTTTHARGGALLCRGEWILDIHGLDKCLRLPDGYSSKVTFPLVSTEQDKSVDRYYSRSFYAHLPYQDSAEWAKAVRSQAQFLLNGGDGAPPSLRVVFHATDGRTLTWRLMASHTGIRADLSSREPLWYYHLLHSQMFRVTYGDHRSRIRNFEEWNEVHLPEHGRRLIVVSDNELGTQMSSVRFSHENYEEEEVEMTAEKMEGDGGGGTVPTSESGEHELQPRHESSAEDGGCEEEQEKLAKGMRRVPRAQPRTMCHTMHRHQLRALEWMCEIERDRLETVTIGFRTQPFSCGGLRPEMLDVHLVTQGGIYADEMGLGKTISMIGLILAHPRRSESGSPSRPRALHPSHSTLVLCPSHLAKQWKDEIQKWSGLTAVVLTTTSQWSKVTYERLMATDVVIVSHALLRNRAYVGAVGNVTGFHDVQVGEAVPRSGRRTRRGAVNPFDVALNCPVLQRIDWHRIVLDEGHEVITEGGTMQDMLDLFRANFKWYMTGTPLSQGLLTLQMAVDFIGLRLHASSLTGSEWLRQGLMGRALMYAVRTGAYWRNTKESVGFHRKVPPVVEEVIFIDPTDVERAMYQAAAVTNDVRRMRQLCCHPQISARDREIHGETVVGLEEIREQLLAHHKAQLTNGLRDHERAVAALAAFEERREMKMVKRAQQLSLLEANEDAVALVEFTRACEREDRDYTTQRKRLERSLGEAEQFVRDERSRGGYFDALIPRATSQLKEPCLICFDDIETAAITKCAHIFCIQCIRSAVNVHHNCPVCRTALRAADVRLVGTGGEERRENTLLQRHGAKMARLVYFLRKVLNESPDNRVIVFSQWDAMLHRIGDTLGEAGIASLYCRGNVHIRNNALDKFKGSDAEAPRVLMLSIDKAASGTNLTEATHIVLVDPVYGTKEHADAIESQAIGRSHRMGQDKQLRVVRLIMRNTVESEMLRACE